MSPFFLENKVTQKKKKKKKKKSELQMETLTMRPVHAGDDDGAVLVDGGLGGVLVEVQGHRLDPPAPSRWPSPPVTTVPLTAIVSYLQ